MNDTIATDRLPVQEKMTKANLIDKFLKNKAEAKIRATAPAPKRDSLPDPQQVPSDVPEGNTTTEVLLPRGVAKGRK